MIKFLRKFNSDKRWQFLSEIFKIVFCVTSRGKERNKKFYDTASVAVVWFESMLKKRFF